MAAISIVSGTSLNAFFHPCENLQSIAIQCDWHGANSELLSCIIKTKLYYQRAEKVGPGQVPLLSLERAKMRCERAMGKEAHSCSGWQDRLVLLWKDFHPRPPAGTLSAGAAAMIRKISRALAQQLASLRIYCYPNCTTSGFPPLPVEDQEGPTESLDILGISGFIISENVCFGVYSDDSWGSNNGVMLSWECFF